MDTLVRLSDRRDVMTVALSICLDAWNPYRIEYPEAEDAAALDEMYELIIRKRQAASSDSDI